MSPFSQRAAIYASAFSQNPEFFAFYRRLRAYECSLAEGLLFERREFHATFALDDQKEGMRAFVGKRKPTFRNR